MVIMKPSSPNSSASSGRAERPPEVQGFRLDRCEIVRRFIAIKGINQRVTHRSMLTIPVPVGDFGDPRLGATSDAHFPTQLSLRRVPEPVREDVDFGCKGLVWGGNGKFFSPVTDFRGLGQRSEVLGGRSQMARHTATARVGFPRTVRFTRCSMSLTSRFQIGPSNQAFTLCARNLIIGPILYSKEKGEIDASCTQTGARRAHHSVVRVRGARIRS